MHDTPLRIQMEKRLNKTTSRKANSLQSSARVSAVQSPVTSPGNSQPGSRIHSRAGSRYVSEDELSDDGLEDLEASGISAVDLEAASESALTSLLSTLRDRKESNTTRRYKLERYISILRINPKTEEVVRQSLSDILPWLIKSINRVDEPEEQMLALTALAVTAITAAEDQAYLETLKSAKTICMDSGNEGVKAQALSTMATVIVYGGALEAEMHEFLEFLIRITESDGEHINALDSGAVVISAMDAFAFVSSNVDGLEDQGQPALEAFIEQLDSADVEVQTTAGANIAQLFEMERDLEEDYNDESWGTLNLQVDRKFLIKKMTELSTRTAKTLSRRKRGHVRSNFTDLITSLTLGKGPGYTTSRRPEVNPHKPGHKASHKAQNSAYKGKVRAGDEVFFIQTWASQARLNMLKWALQSGFSIHFVENETVRESLEDLEQGEDQSDSDSHASSGVGSTTGTDSPRKKGRGSGKKFQIWN